MKRLRVLLVAVALVLIMAAAAYADDYEVPPGVKSPDEVDFGGKTVTIIRGALPADDERVELAKQLFNVELETLRLESADQIMARIMAGDSKYDILRTPIAKGISLWFPQGCSCRSTISCLMNSLNGCPM